MVLNLRDAGYFNKFSLSLATGRYTSSPVTLETILLIALGSTIALVCTPKDFQINNMMVAIDTVADTLSGILKLHCVITMTKRAGDK